MDKNKVELDALLLNHFGPQAVKSIITEPLNSQGQYFSSFVLKGKVFLENYNEKSQVDLIIKMLPSKENDIESNSKLKFKKEIDFYRLAVPEYHRIQANNNLPRQNLFPLFYTASEKVIVVKNLHADGYLICDSMLNEAQSKLVLQELAKFHATGVVLKLTTPKVFEELSSVMIPALQNACNPDRDEINSKFRFEITELLRCNDMLKGFAESVDLLLNYIDTTKLPPPSEPFSTLLHNDLWRGNIMFDYSSSVGELIDVKFIDFQTVIFNSPARDIIYFLFTSVEDSVLSQFSDLIHFYHFCFVTYLSDLGLVDLSEFTYDKLVFEINSYGPSKLKHVLLLFKALCSVGDRQENFEQCLQRVVILFKDRGWINPS